jgi:dCMP deaminase
MNEDRQVRWDRHFLKLAMVHGSLSKDPSTKVGAVIIGPDQEIISMGFNGFPRGILDSAERLTDRDMKLKLVVHGEMNAILIAARNGIRLKGSTMYIVAQDKNGDCWGGAGCTRCTVEMIQAGIAKVVSYPLHTAPARWHDDCRFAQGLMIEAGMEYREVDL